MTWALCKDLHGQSLIYSRENLNHILLGFHRIVFWKSRKWAAAGKWPELSGTHAVSIHVLQRRIHSPRATGHCLPGEVCWAEYLASKEPTLDAVVKLGQRTGESLLHLLIFWIGQEKMDGLCSLLIPVLLMQGLLLFFLRMPVLCVWVRGEELDFLTWENVQWKSVIKETQPPCCVSLLN